MCRPEQHVYALKGLGSQLPAVRHMGPRGNQVLADVETPASCAVELAAKPKRTDLPF